MPLSLNRRAFLRTLAQGAAVLALPRVLRAAATPANRPNILYIMSDDHSALSISCYGSTRNQTPNIDRIARDGIRLTHCFCVDSICTPSRGAIVSGKYGHITGVRNLGDILPASTVTFPRLLQQAGYQTGIIGKWHLSGNSAPNPQPQGFDYWNVLPGQGKYNNPTLWENGKEKQYNGYVTDIIADLALEFLKRRDKQRPFCLLVHNKAPHGSWEYDQKHAAMFEGQTIPEAPTLWDDHKGQSSAVRDSGRTIANLAKRMAAAKWPTGTLDTKGMTEKQAAAAAYQKYLKDYLRCVASVDDNVGRLLDYLDAEGLARNTVVVYTSDQGMYLGEHGFMDKRLMYEEALRMPLLVRYPPEIKPAATCDRMVLNIDFAETLLDFAGLPAPADMQGRSFRPLLRGEAIDGWRTSMFYRYYMPGDTPPHYGIRNEHCKLIHYVDTGEWELFDLRKDPLELTSVYADPAYAGVIKDMKDDLARLCHDLKVSDAELAPGRTPAGKAGKGARKAAAAEEENG